MKDKDYLGYPVPPDPGHNNNLKLLHHKTNFRRAENEPLNLIFEAGSQRIVWSLKIRRFWKSFPHSSRGRRAEGQSIFTNFASLNSTVPSFLGNRIYGPVIFTDPMDLYPIHILLKRLDGRSLLRGRCSSIFSSAPERAKGKTRFVSQSWWLAIDLFAADLAAY